MVTSICYPYIYIKPRKNEILNTSHYANATGPPSGPNTRDVNSQEISLPVLEAQIPGLVESQYGPLLQGLLSNGNEYVQGPSPSPAGRFAETYLSNCHVDTYLFRYHCISICLFVSNRCLLFGFFQISGVGNSIPGFELFDRIPHFLIEYCIPNYGRPTGQAIIFCSCGLYLLSSSSLIISRRKHPASQTGCLPYIHMMWP